MLTHWSTNCRASEIGNLSKGSEFQASCFSSICFQAASFI